MAVPVIIPPNHVQVCFNWEGPLIPDGQGCTVFGSTVASSDPAATAADWTTSFLAAFVGSLSDQVTLTTVDWYTADEGGSVLVDETGGASGDPCPPNVSIMFRKVTSVRGRRAQGRMFPPGLIYDEQVGVNGLIDPATVTGRTTQANNWLADAVGNMVILQNSEGNSPPLSPPPPVTALLCDARVSTQRKRLR